MKCNAQAIDQFSSMSSDYTTCKDVAAKTGLHVTTIRTLCRTGRIQAVRLGKIWHIQKTVLNGKKEVQK